MKVFITREIPEIAGKLLKENNIKVNVFKEDQPISKETLISKVKDADGVISLLSDKIDKEVIEAMPSCKVIANYAVGYNNIDISFAKEKGIVVTNTPDVLTDATAEIAIALTLACTRRIPEGENLMRFNQFKGWAPKLLLGPGLTGKTFGIIGAGRIGTATAVRAKAFGTKIIYYSRSKNKELEKLTGAKKVTLEALLKNADVISIHLPLTLETYHLLDKKKLALLKNTAVLVNTARGEIVDEKELIKLLNKNKLFAAGFDVYENEPKINNELFDMNNVVLLPHLGSATIESRNKMAELAAKNIISVLKGKKPLTPVQ